MRAQRRDRAAGARDDADDRHRRHRSVGGLDDGPGRGDVRRGVTRLGTGRCRAARARAGARAAPAARSTRRSIARLGIPPLIVTLGTFSLFRGIAEGITHGAVNYSGFPPAFLFSARATSAASCRRRCRCSSLVFALYVVLLHRSVDRARACYAIGFTPEGARYAGIPVARRARACVTCCRVWSRAWRRSCTWRISARREPTRAPATNSTRSPPSCSAAPRSSAAAAALWGTLLGLVAIAVLQNGLRLAALPAELAGMLDGRRCWSRRSARSIAHAARRCRRRHLE